MTETMPSDGPRTYTLNAPRSTVPALYTNGVAGQLSQWDITLFFQYNTAALPVTGTAVEPVSQSVAKLVMSPQHAKALIAVVQDAVAKWERAFGDLPGLDKLIPGGVVSDGE